MEQRIQYIHEKRILLPKYKKIIDYRIIKTISSQVEKEFYFYDRENILRNKNVIIDFLSHLEIDVNKIKKSKKQNQKKVKKEDVVNALNKLKKNEKEIDSFLKKF